MKKFRTILIGVIAISSLLLFRGKISHQKFDSNLWKTANLNLEDNMSLRWDMMNDLRKKHNLVGMTKSEVVDLLGEPGDSSRIEYYYYLGYSKVGINTGRLTITFNNENIVTEIRVRQG